MTLEELYSQAKRLSRQEKINLAGNSGVKVLDYLKSRGFDGEKAFKFILYLTALFAGADGDLSSEEWDLFVQVTGMKDLTHAKFKEAFQGFLGDREFVQSMDDVIDSWPDEIKGAACYYGLAFIAADGVIDSRERAVFEKILG